MKAVSAIVSILLLGAGGMQAQPASTIRYHVDGGEQIVEITNVNWWVVHGGGPLVLRATTRSREVIDEKGSESKVTLEAWPLGKDVASKPLYGVEVQGSEASLLDGELWQVADWTDGDVGIWSLYDVRIGRRFVESFVPPLAMRVEADPSMHTYVNRYAGLYVPPDDVTDARLRDKRTVAVLSYVSSGRVLAEALLTCDDPKRATELRSYSDTDRVLAFVETPQAIEIRFADPLTRARRATVRIPVSENGLDLRHATAPAGFRVTLWN